MDEIKKENNGGPTPSSVYVPKVFKVNDREKILNIALSYAKLGLKVFPIHYIDDSGGCSCYNQYKPEKKCSNLGKHPVIWGGFKNASTDETKIRRWWRKRPYNIGVPCGKESKILVVDVDGEVGLNSLVEKDRKNEIICNNKIIIDTPISKTGREGFGRHIFFKYPQDVIIKNSTKVLPGIDIRAEGGYVVFPPSNHLSGNTYSWEKDISNTPLKDLPVWLKEILTNSKDSEKTLNNLQLIDLVASEIIPEGIRDDSLYRFGCSLRDKGFKEDMIEFFLSKTNKVMCKPPLDEIEIKNITQSCCKHEPKHSITKDLTNIKNTDQGNAKRMVHYFKNELRYCGQSRKWLVWNGKCWRDDETGYAQRCVKKVVMNMYKESSETEDEIKRKELVKWAVKCEALVHQKHMLESAESEPEFAVSLNDFYSEPRFFNLQNCVLDTQTLEILPHDPQRLITMISNGIYDPSATCPKWGNALQVIFDHNERLIKYFQRVCGYILTGIPREQTFFFLFGEEGGNGKSTLMNIILHIMGEYGLKADIKSFLDCGNNMSIRNDLARMAGKRFVWASEPEEGKKYSMEILKQITGNEPITCRFLRQEYFEYVPQFSLFITANNRPTISEKSDAAWRRLQSIPFNISIPKKMRNKHIEEELKLESSGILNWILEGLKMYKRNGLQPPQEILDSIKKYKEDMNTIECFLGECCIMDKKIISIIKNSELYDEYKKYCEDRGLHKDSLKVFIKEIKKISEKENQIEEKISHKVMFWSGIRMREDNEVVIEPKRSLQSNIVNN